MDEPKISITLGVYNGTRFLEEQVKSYFSQKHSRWDLLARDDHSQDNSLQLLKCLFVNEDRVSFVAEYEGNQGVTRNYGLLLESARDSACDYIALSDQDDVWEEDKLQEQLMLMRQIEKEMPGKPVLVHSDMQLVDESLGPIAPSYMRYQGLRHESRDPLKVLLLQNFVTGCTVLVNRPLLNMALPLPKEAVIFDWWLALCATVFGKIAYVDKPLLKYRQHGKNVVGAKSLANLMNPFKTNYFQFWTGGQKRLTGSLRQAEALARRMREYGCINGELELIEDYARLQQLSPVKRIRKMSELGLHAQSNLRQLLILSRLFLLSSDRKG